MSIALVCPVAGLSSRFGGKIKQFALVGPKGETLIEYSLGQALPAGFAKIIFVVGEKTEKPFKEKFGDSYMNVPVFYARQVLDPQERDKSWGTVDALCAAKDLIDGDLVFCNGDDIYGREPFQILVEHLKNHETGAAVGYRIKDVLSAAGPVNRGRFEVNADGTVGSVEEKFDLTADNLTEKGFKADDLCSMNIWGLKRETVAMLAEILAEFKKTYAGDRQKECLLPEKLSALVKAGRIVLKIYRTDVKWFGVTNPDDESKVKSELIELAKSGE